MFHHDLISMEIVVLAKTIYEPPFVSVVEVLNVQVQIQEQLSEQEHSYDV